MHFLHKQNRLNSLCKIRVRHGQWSGCTSILTPSSRGVVGFAGAAHKLSYKLFAVVSSLRRLPLFALAITHSPVKKLVPKKASPSHNIVMLAVSWGRFRVHCPRTQGPI